MQRETQALRTLAGKPGDSDLEPMLQAAAAAWPNERPPVENLRFEPGKLTLARDRLDRRRRSSSSAACCSPPAARSTPAKAGSS